MSMKSKTKTVEPGNGSHRIAEMICDALEKLPLEEQEAEEQEARVKAISNIKITDRRITS
jgi:hypothetical protein